jgi:hypothetical protein
MSAVMAGDPDPWVLGWDSVVAGATIFLALGTLWLAIKTSRLADAAREEISGAWRPVMLVASAHVELQGEGRFTAIVVARNRGNGPALDARASGAGAALPDDRDGKAVGVDDVLIHRFAVDGTSGEWPLMVRYRDLGGREHETSALLVGPGGVGGACKISKTRARSLKH